MNLSDLSILVLPLFCLFGTAVARFGPCALPFRKLNTRVCYQYIKMAAESPHKYWFGSQFKQKCRNDPDPRSAFCFNPVPPGAGRFSFQTLGSRLFGTESFRSAEHLALLNNSISVKYDSWPGWIEGCDSSQFSPMRYVFDVNPNMVPTRAFSVRNPPQVFVDGCNTTHPCTLVFHDAAVGILHNIWTNWPRTNRNLPGYQPPQNPNIHPNTYVWLAYRQEKPLPQDIPTSHLPYSFDLLQFAREHELEGPIAMTWMMVGGDISALTRLEKNGIYSRGSCANMLENELKYERLELLSDIDEMIDDNKLKFFLAAKFTDPHTGKRVKVDAMNNGILPLHFALQAPELSIAPRIFGKPSPDDIKGRNFTMIMMQPDLGSKEGGGGAFLHWLVSNIPDGVVQRGDHLLFYQPPGSQGYSSQMYILLYEQSQYVFPPLKFYSRNCPPGTHTRCQFPLKDFVKESGLTLTALTRFKLQGPSNPRVFPFPAGPPLLPGPFSSLIPPPQLPPRPSNPPPRPPLPTLPSNPARPAPSVMVDKPLLPSTGSNSGSRRFHPLRPAPFLGNRLGLAGRRFHAFF